MTDLTDVLSFSGKRHVTTISGPPAYTRSSIGSFEVAEVQEKHIETEKDLQAIHSAN
jgi:hypothetical protein